MNHDNRQETQMSVKPMAEFCEAVFNAPEFQQLFTGDFAADEKIYLSVGGALMRYVNLTKNFDTKQVFEILQKIHQSDIFQRMHAHFLPNDETRMFREFFAPAVLDEIKNRLGGEVAAVTNYLVQAFDHYTLTNAFNGYHVDRVRTQGFDCTQGDPFEKEYQILGEFFDKAKYSASATYFGDPSYVSMRFCQISPERLYVMLYDHLQRNPQESLQDFLWRRFKLRFENMAEDPELRDKMAARQNGLNQAVAKLTQAYGTETAGIAMLPMRDFMRLCSEDIREEFITKRQHYCQLITERAAKVQPDKESLLDYITSSVSMVDFCKGGIGRRIVGKIAPNLIAVARVPQAGLLSLNQQRTKQNVVGYEIN